VPRGLVAWANGPDVEYLTWSPDGRPETWHVVLLDTEDLDTWTFNIEQEDQQARDYQEAREIDWRLVSEHPFGRNDVCRGAAKPSKQGESRRSPRAWVRSRC